MVVIAITRGGSGSIWKFSSIEAADCHPLIQYGDPIYPSLSSLDNRAQLASRLGVSEFGLWDHLIRNANDPTAFSSDDLFEIIIEDKKWTRKFGVSYTTKQETSMTSVEVEAPVKTPRTKRIPKTAKELPVKNDMIITVTVPENPKRKGSEAFEIFNRYQNGMTVKQAKEVGMDNRLIRHDAEMGYIALSLPEA